MTDYFGKPACLAQSPQLYKQMAAACGGFGRVMEVRDNAVMQVVAIYTVHTHSYRLHIVLRGEHGGQKGGLWC